MCKLHFFRSCFYFVCHNLPLKTFLHNNITTYNMQPIYINEFCEKVTKLNSSSNKVEFIENYTECKKTIDIFDEIMQLTSDTSKYDDKPLDDLLAMIKDFDDAISDNADFTIDEFKEMTMLVEYVEKKLNEDDMRVIEINNNY